MTEDRDDRLIRLANQPQFHLGALAVTPATRQVAWSGESRTLEPRVMQVLVALASADGAVVGRDELIERCWEGRAVGGNAINRVISILRQLAADTGAFRLETVTKVGYRLASGAARSPAPDSPPARRGAFSRRAAIAGGVAMGAAAAVGYGLWRLRAEAPIPPAAATYLRKGREALEAARPDLDQQAVAYLRRAVDLAPRSGEAWGALSLAYVTQVGARGEDALGRDVDWVRSAASRALELDPGNPEAQAALVLARPLFRHWWSRDVDFRDALRRHPGFPPLVAGYANLLIEVGRWREAAEHLQKLVAAHPMSPTYQMQLAATLWGADRLAEADRAFADAVRLWPAHPWAWTARFDFLMLNGRPAEAIATASDRLLTPGGDSPMPVDLGLIVAGALQDGGQARGDRAVAAIRAARRDGQLWSPKAIAYLTALGALDDAFSVIEAFYFSGAAANASAAALPIARPTFILFGRAAAPLRADPRFPPLLSRLDLETYWRASRTQPDYRR